MSENESSRPATKPPGCVASGPPLPLGDANRRPEFDDQDDLGPRQLAALHGRRGALGVVHPTNARKRAQGCWGRCGAAHSNEPLDGRARRGSARLEHPESFKQSYSSGVDARVAVVEKALTGS